MFNFNLKETTIFKTVIWEKSIFFRFVKILKKLFLVLFIIAFLFFFYGLELQNFPKFLNRKLFGLSIIFLTLYIISWIQESFLNSKIKKPGLETKLEQAVLKPEQYNLAEFLGFEAAKSVFKSIRCATSKKPGLGTEFGARLARLMKFILFRKQAPIARIPQIDSSFLFYFLLRDNPKLDFIFRRSLLNLKETRKILGKNIKTLKRIHLTALPIKETKNKGSKEIFDSSFQNVILESLKIAEKKNHQRVEVLDLIPALAKYDSIFKKVLINSDLKSKDIENLCLWLENLEKKETDRKGFWKLKNLLKISSLGKEWAMGYTVDLDKFSTDISKTVRVRGFPEVIGHQKAIEATERILSRREDNNVLIVGEPGSGRKSIIRALTERSALGESLPNVNYKKVVELNLPLLLSQTEGLNKTGDILEKIFNEVVSAGNIILVIDEFHNFISGEARPGVIDISGILTHYLNLPQFQIIAITTYRGLHKYIEQNPSLLNLFEKVDISEVSPRETLIILENLVSELEAKYKKFISYQTLGSIIFYCDKYLADSPFPEKATELLDEIMVYVAQKKEKVVLPEHVAEIISYKTEIPVGKIEVKEREILLNLEDLIHKRIINQEEAVKEVSNALRRARTEITTKKGPMGSFLFLGPTGVGKTETSKALTEIYFGSENKMIRLDMSEFQDISDIPRLIGSSGEEGILTTQVKENPFSSILLDEIEKAHPNILNLFLQVLDEGHLTDGLGRKINFKNTIITATSNAGYLIILEALKMNKKMSEIKDELLDFLFKQGIFRPEFINRFDAVVLFKVLTKGNLLDIAELLFQKLKKDLFQKDIEFIITQGLKEKIVELSYDPKFGAREMKRVIQDKIGNVLAKALLSDQLKKGDKVEIDSENFTLKINS